MIEVTIFNYLKSHLSEAVVMEVPPNPPAKFYVIQKTGSDRVNRINRSTFAIQSYGPSLYDAASMNETMINEMLEGLIEDPDIADVSLNSDYDYTDTQSKRYRYQAVFDITHY